MALCREFSAAGVAGAWAGSSLAMKVPGDQLFALFGTLMTVVGILAGQRLGRRRGALSVVFVVFVILIGLYVA